MARGVTVTVGIDPAQVHAAYRLHALWAEEEGYEMDTDGWADLMRGLCVGGRYTLGVAWDGDLPVGVAEMHVLYDPMTRQTVAYGERGYVLPAYRTEQVFTALVEAWVGLSEFMGVKKMRVPAGLDLRGRALRRLYERLGFKAVSTTLERIL